MRDESFTWRDGERTITFGPSAIEDAPGSLEWNGWTGYELLTTQRALDGAPEALAGKASRVLSVRQGAVNEIAAELLDDVRANHLVAFGGGRVIDTAKAIAAVTGARVAAIPTTLSGAEMTRIHKLPDGREAKDGLVRPALVFAEPNAMTAQPEQDRRASAMNALAHAADSLYTPLAHPVSRLAALDGARLIAAGLDDEGDRHSLALGAILAGYAIDSALFSLHHVICQSLVRVLRTPHAETNAAILPRAVEALIPRAPEEMTALADALGTDDSGLIARIEALARRSPRARRGRRRRGEARRGARCDRGPLRTWNDAGHAGSRGASANHRIRLVTTPPRRVALSLWRIASESPRPRARTTSSPRSALTRTTALRASTARTDSSTPSSAAIFLPFFLIWFRLERQGREHSRVKGGLIVASNHRSFLDPFVIGALLPWRRSDPVRRQGRAFRKALAGLVPQPPRRLPDPPRPVGRDRCRDRAPRGRARRHRSDLPRGHSDPPGLARPARSGESAAWRSSRALR